MASQAVLELLVELKDQASGGLASLGGALKTVGGVAGGVALAGVAAFGAAVVKGVGDAQQTAKLMAQTEAVIKSTGGAAGVSAQQVADLASSLSDAAGASVFGDDQIQAGENLLLTFTNIKETLPDATKIMVDMAQAMGTDVKGGAIQLGKALNDPIAGISALSRVGVTFTDAQKAQIKAMQDAGNTAGAQKVILAELNKEFGGSAEAAAAATGGWSELKGRLGEAAEAVGTALLPLLSQLAGFLLTTIVPAIETAAAAISAWLSDPAVQAGIQAIGDAITTGLGAAFTWISQTAIPALIAGWALLQPAVMLVIGWFQNQIPAATSTLTDLWTNTLLPAITTLVGWFQTAIPAAIAILTTSWNTTLLPIVNALVTLWQTSLQPALSDLMAWFAANLPGAIQVLVGFWTSTLQPAIAVVAQFIATTLIPAIGVLVDWLRANLPAAIQTVSAFWTGTLQPAISAVWGFIVNSVIPTVTSLAGTVFGALSSAVQTVAGFWTGTLQPALNAVWSFLQTYVIPILTALANVAIALVKKELQLLAAIWTNILQPALNAVWSFIQTNVVPILTTLANTAIAGVKSATEGLSSFWTGTLKPAIDTVVSAISTALRPALSGLETIIGSVAGWFGTISDAVSGVVDWLQKLADKINSIDIPDWAKGHSPPPLAQWFDYIAESAGGASQAIGDLTFPTAPRMGALSFATAGVGAGAFGGGGSLTINVTISGGTGRERSDAQSGVEAALQAIGARADARIRSGG